MKEAYSELYKSNRWRTIPFQKRFLLFFKKRYIVFDWVNNNDFYAFEYKYLFGVIYVVEERTNKGKERDERTNERSIRTN